MVEIGRQNRPRLYDLFFEKPQPLVSRHLRFEVDERVLPDSTVLRPADPAEVDPLLFTAYRIREGSGGAGRWRGGDGIIRAFKVLTPTRLAILADRFKIGPWGLNGGGSGKPGRAYIKRPDGRVVELHSKTVVDGDEVVIETPGGGGWGTPL